MSTHTHRHTQTHTHSHTHTHTHTHRHTHRHTHLYPNRFDVKKKYPGYQPTKKSDPETLQRVQRVTNQWFRLMGNQIRRLDLLKSPRTRGEDKLLVSFPPCKPQKLHWDFDPDTVQKLIREDKFEGIPISTICSFSPQGSFQL